MTLEDSVLLSILSLSVCTLWRATGEGAPCTLGASLWLWSSAWVEPSPSETLNVGRRHSA